MECSVECFVFSFGGLVFFGWDGWRRYGLCSPHQWSLSVRGEVITQTGENGAGALFGIQYSPSSGSAKKSVADLTKPVTVFPPVREIRLLGTSVWISADVWKSRDRLSINCRASDVAIGWQLRSRLHPGQPHARPGGAVIDKQELINIPALPKFIPSPECFQKLSQIANKHKLCGSINEALSL